MYELTLVIINMLTNLKCLTLATTISGYFVILRLTLDIALIVQNLTTLALAIPEI